MTVVQLLEELRADGVRLDVVDGALRLSCLPILCRDLSAMLRRQPLTPPHRQFDDYVRAERAWRESAACRDAAAFWQASIPQPIPGWQWPPVTIEPGQGQMIGSALGASLSDGVRRLARKRHASSFVVFLTAYQVLLCRYAGLREVVVGAPVSNRPGPDYAAAIGDFTNLLLFPLAPGEAGFAELVARNASFLAAATDHARLPFLDLPGLLESRPPDHGRGLLQATMSWHRKAESPEDAVFGEAFLPARQSGSPSGLTLTVTDAAAGFVLEWQWDPRRLDSGTVSTLSDAMSALLAEAIQDPGARASELALLSLADRQRLLSKASGGNRVFPAIGVGALVQSRVVATPDKPALLTGDVAITYRSLGERSNQLAAHLRQHGAGRGTVVGIHLDRSAEMVLVMLAILKLGGIYLPLDLAHPPERLALIAGNACAAIIVSRSAHAASLPASGAGHILLDIDACAIAACMTRAVPAEILPDDPAYLIYTSGSTGMPKGVVVSHRNIGRLIDAMSDHVTCSDVILHAASPAFDAATFEIWCALGLGATCAILPGGVPDIAQIERCVRDHRVSAAFVTTALFNAIVAEHAGILSPLRLLLFGGEAISRKHVTKALRHLPGTVLLHAYGPTECTTFSTLCVVSHRPDRAFPIGRPIANTSAYILDESRQILPAGAIGQLHIGGAGVALGYAGDPALTGSRFIADPFTGNGRLYCTGDLARLLPDGNIDFVGRADDQIKLRGFRIELGDIRHALIRAGADDAAIVLDESEATGKRIIAYVVAPSADADALGAAIARTLPRYMIPSAIVMLDSLPLNPSGKIDRRRLPAPEAAIAPCAQAPHPRLEHAIAALFCTLLGRAELPRDADFFDLGGDSLKAMQLSSRLREHLGIDIGIAGIFRCRTIAALGAAAASASARPA